jgi:hypothetical protein
MLAGFLPAWDVERRRADVSEVVAWALDEIRALGVVAASLQRLHDVTDATGAARVACQLTRAVAQPCALARVRAVVRAAVPELPWARVDFRTRPRFRVLVPGDASAPLPLHTDFDAGRSLDERNVWIALTPARGGGSLRFASLAESLLARSGRAVASRPAHAERGDVLLFTPLHVHGAQVVDHDETRVSIDVRIAPSPAPVEPRV